MFMQSRLFFFILFHEAAHAGRFPQHILACGPAEDLSPVHTAFQRDCVVHALVKQFAVLFVFFERQRFQRLAAVDAAGHERAP